MLIKIYCLKKISKILLEGLLGINDTWYRKRSDSITDFNEANKTGYILLQHVQSMDNKPNTPSNYGYLDTILLKMATSGRLIQICRADFLFDHLITGFGLIGNKCRQHSIKNKLDFNEIKRMGAGPHPSAPHVTKEL